MGETGAIPVPPGAEKSAILAAGAAAAKAGVGKRAWAGSLASWREWKQCCAIGLCSPAVQHELRNFAGIHFTRNLQRYAHRTNTSSAIEYLEDRDAWHLFETHLAVRNTRQGKRYKDWLFARLSGDEGVDLEALAGGAALLMRDAARELLRREFAPPETVWLGLPAVGAGEGGLTIEDLLPGSIDPVDEVSRREYEQFASRHATELVRDMSPRQKIAVLAKDLGVSLADPAAEKAAGCRKSILNQTYQEFVLSVSRVLRRSYPDDGAGSVRILTLMTLEEINTLVREWGKSTLACARIFAAAESP